MPTSAATDVGGWGPSTVRVDVDVRTGRVTVATSGVGARSAETPDGDLSDSSFGLFGSGEPGPMSQLGSTLASGIKAATDHMSNLMNQLLSEVSTLEVATYSSEDLANVEYDAQSQSFWGSHHLREQRCPAHDGDEPQN